MEDGIIRIKVGSKLAPLSQKTVFRVTRSLIMTESITMRKKILENPSCNMILVDCDHPKIFKIALDFINGKNLDEVKDLNTLFSLDAVAEKFKMEKLNRTCVHMLNAAVSFQTVWKLYENCKYKRVEESCEWLLSTRTLELLNYPGFLEIEPQTLARFLRLEEMNIESESVLLEACLRFVATEVHGPEREVFREYALPHLRVLNLFTPDIFHLQSFLTPEEFDFLSYRKRAPEVPGLCLDERDRRPANYCTLVIEPDKDIYDKLDLDWPGPFIPSPTQKDRFVLSFKMKKLALLQRMVFFIPRCLLADEFNYREISGSPPPPYPQVIAKVNISMKEREDEDLSFELHSTDMFLNRTASIKFNNVVAPKSARVKIEIEMYGAFAFYEFDKSKSTIFECSDPSIKEVLKKVKLKHLHDGKERKEDWNTTVFKSVHMKLI